MYKSSVNISIGCDKECTYCIVPATRGDEISIPPEMIVTQVKKRCSKWSKRDYSIRSKCKLIWKKIF